MRDIKEWAEAQRKKGYTSEQLKQYLARKGYPTTALEEAYKMKKPYARKPGKVILILALIAITGLVLLLLFDKLSTKKVGNEQALQIEGEAAALPENLKAEAISLIKQNVKQEFLPSEFTFQTDPRGQGTLSYAWDAGDNDFLVAYQLDEQQKNVDTLRITARLNITTKLTPRSAWELMTDTFIDVPVMECKNLTGDITCEDEKKEPGATRITWIRQTTPASQSSPYASPYATASVCLTKNNNRNFCGLK